MKQTIAFDLDGTLIDISCRDYKIYYDIVREIHGLPILFENYWAMRKAKTDIHKILSLSGVVASDDVEYFLRERKGRMEEMEYLKYDELQLGALEVLRSLSWNFNICIVTIRYNKENTNWQLSKLSLDKYDIYIVESNKEDVMMRISGLFAMVGDTENDIIPANKIGIKSIAVTTGIRNEEQLKQLNPTYLVDSLNDIRAILL